LKDKGALKLWMTAIVSLVITGVLISGCVNLNKRDAVRKLDDKIKATGATSGILKTIVLGGGCFWCTDAVFNRVKGVLDSTAGYAGGTAKNPGYKAVCRGNTGHAEVVQLTYDPAQISLEQILEIFFAAHDPTTVNRQGYDEGDQYRSVILYTTGDQKAVTEASIKKAQADHKDPIVTEVAKLDVFYPAEDYHQDYFEKNPHAPYCSSIISPKLKKVKEKFGLE
jgi:peptide-methionine (S)-S-oxide reductase